MNTFCQLNIYYLFLPEKAEWERTNKSEDTGVVGIINYGYNRKWDINIQQAWNPVNLFIIQIMRYGHAIRSQSQIIEYRSCILVYSRSMYFVCTNIQKHIQGERDAKECSSYTTLYWTVLLVVGKDNAHTYLHYFLPAHPDHYCEKDALVRRKRAPEGSYPGLSGRRGDYVDWTQIKSLLYFKMVPFLKWI